MFKKSLIAVLFSFIMAMVLGTSVFAADNGEVVKVDAATEMTPEIASALSEVNKINDKIYAEIDKAVAKSEKMHTKFLEQQAKQTDPAKQAKLKADYDKKYEKLIADLKTKAEKMTLKGIEKAEKAGLVVEIEFVEVSFPKGPESIDPILVVGW